jgi:hypothetical protein
MSDDQTDLRKSVDEALSKLDGGSGSSVRGWIDIALKTLIAVLAFLGTSYLSSQKQFEDALLASQHQSNEDVRLVVELVGGDTAHRAIGIAIAKAYAGKRIPIEVLDAVNAYAISNSTRTEAEQINTTAGQVRENPEVIKATQAKIIMPNLRIYIQYSRQADDDAVALMRQSLGRMTVEDKQVIVPPPELVKTVIQAPVLKCFRKIECGDLATSLLSALKMAGAPSDTKLVLIEGNENSTVIRPNHFEAWFPPLLSPNPQ